ncbi:undecaprenyl-diphosphate phosphatase [Candidatus Neomarinimicrobiota bacterium]
MNWFDTIVLGIVQGATEFLPVSSSAHLVLGQHILNLKSAGLDLEVVLHLGTLLSVLIYFRDDILALITGLFKGGEQGRSVRGEIGLLIVATVPAVIVALTLDDVIEAAFDDVQLVGVALLVTTVTLASSRLIKGTGSNLIGWRLALLIGLAQACAIFPGISRSGATIVAGLWLGLSADRAARWSFLMAIPAIVGAGLFTLLDLEGMAIAPFYLIIGFTASAATGYLVIGWLMNILRKGQLHYFGAYTLLVGLIIIFH